MGKKLNDQSEEAIKDNHLKQDPEGHMPSDYVETNLIIAKNIPRDVPKRKVVFLNQRDPGIALHFHYASGTIPLKNYTLYHGFEHELPVEIIDHLETCAECQYGHRKNTEGHPECYVKGHKYIFQFRNSKKAV